MHYQVERVAIVWGLECQSDHSSLCRDVIMNILDLCPRIFYSPSQCSD